MYVRLFTTIAVVALFSLGSALAQQDENGQPTQYPLSPRWGLAALVQRQLMRCWMPPKRLVGTNLAATVRFKLNRDGSLADVPTVVKPATDSLSQSASESALRAVRQCTPLNLPADKYEYWQEVIATFDPRKLR
jgi:hypothetical protein